MKRIFWIGLTAGLVFGPLSGVVGQLHASDAGTTGAGFLKLGVGPRATAMANAQASLADDVYATYWNPAGLAQLQVPEVGLTYNQYLQNTSQQYAAFALPQEKWGTFAGSINFFNVGSFQGYDAAGQRIGDVQANDLALSGSFARSIYKNRRKGSSLAVGVTGKYIRESLAGISASAMALDGGIHWTAGKSLGEELDGLRAGLVIKNLGSGLKYDTDSAPLPRTLTAGLSWTGAWLGELFTLAVDAEQPRDGERSYGTGIEIWTLKTLVIRGGYSTQGDVGNGLRLGAGIRFRTLEIDYGFSGAGDLGSAHRIGVLFRFGKKVQEPLAIAESSYDKGMKEYRRGRYSEALVLFNKALEIDPSHPEALEMMQKTYEQIRGPVEVPRE